MFCFIYNRTAEERSQLREMYPYLHEEYKKYHNLTEEEVLERDEYVYDCYVFEEEVSHVFMWEQSTNSFSTLLAVLSYFFASMNCISYRHTMVHGAGILEMVKLWLLSRLHSAVVVCRMNLYMNMSLQGVEILRIQMQKTGTEMTTLMKRMGILMLPEYLAPLRMMM